jgi:hypothetical protein
MIRSAPRRPSWPSVAPLTQRLRPRWLAGLAVAALSVATLGAAQAAPATGLALRVTTPGVAAPAEDGVLEVPASQGTLTLEAATSGASLVVELDGEVVATVDAPEITPVGVTVAPGDDAEEFLGPSRADAARWPAGFTFVSSSDLELGYDPSHTDQLVAIRFTDLGVPAGSRIAFAEVVFTADGPSDGPLRLVIDAERGPAAAGFVEDEAGEPTEALSSRPRTSVSRTWELEEAWRGGDRYATPDLSAIVQEVVDLPGWDEDGSLVLLFVGEEPGTTFRRAVSTAVGDPARAPHLRLDVEPPGTTRAAIAVTIDVPMGSSELVVRAFAGTGGRGDLVGTAGLTVDRSVEAAAPPLAEAEPTAEPEPATEPEPAAEPQPAEEPIAIPQPTAEPEPAPEPPRAEEPEPVAEPEPAEEPEPVAEPAEEPEPVAEPEPAEEPEPVAEPAEEPEAVAEPEVVAEPEPVADPEPAAAEPEPIAALAPPTRSTVVTRIDRFYVRAIRTILGDLEVASYDDATADVTLSWRRPRIAPLTAAVQAGSCVLPGATLVELRTLETTETSVTTRLPISGSALLFGGFVVQVRDGDGATIGCTELGR